MIHRGPKHIPNTSPLKGCDIMDHMEHGMKEKGNDKEKEKAKPKEKAKEPMKGHQHGCGCG